MLWSGADSSGGQPKGWDKARADGDGRSMSESRQVAAGEAVTRVSTEVDARERGGGGETEDAAISICKYLLVASRCAQCGQLTAVFAER